MALLKHISHPDTGMPVSYWRPISHALDAVKRRGVVVFGGWTSEAERAAELLPSYELQIDFGPDVFLAMATAPASGATNYDVIARALYAVARAAPVFADAEDII